MTRKLAIVFAVLALSYIANAAADTNSPASVFAVTPGKVFTNGTDTAFTSLTGDAETGVCYFTGGFDNTTNYVWCQTAYASATVPYTFQRRAINASSPATINSTADTKLASAHYLETNGMTTCSGAGYFGLATGYGTGTSPQYKSDVYFSYAAVNASSFTKVTLTSNSDANMINSAEACFYDNGIFYIVYTSYQYCQSGSETTGCTVNKTQNAVYIQGVNVTSGAVYYNSTGGVKLWSPTSQTIDTINIMDIVGNNQTGYATQGLLLYTDSSASSSTVGKKYNLLPITLSTGAAGSVQTLATGATSSASASATWTSTSTSTSFSSTSTGTSTTSTATSSTSTGTTSTTYTTSSQTSTSTSSTVGTDASTTTLYSTFSTTFTTSSAVTLYSTAYSTFTVTLYSTSSSLSLFTSAVSTGSLTSTMSTSYSLSAFGSLSTYGVVLTQTITTSIPQQTTDTTKTYANSLFFNGSSTASTAANLTNPSGYYLGGVYGFATTDGGFCLIEYFPSTTSGSAAAIYKDTYYYNGTQTTTSVSLGTFQSTPEAFADATGSIWLGYTVKDKSLSPSLYAAYAGEVLYQNLSASTLSSIFATLAIMIAALFAF